MAPIGSITALLCLFIISVYELFKHVLTFIGHSIDNILYRLTQSHSVLFSMIVFLCFSFLIVYTASALVYVSTSHSNNNYQVVGDALFTCESSQFVHTKSQFSSAELYDIDGNTWTTASMMQLQDLNPAKKIVLRLDDVQAHGWTLISIEMMEEAYRRGMPVTAGIIPKGLETDSRITKFLTKYDCAMEYALHGYDNEYQIDNPSAQGEFAELTEQEASEKLVAGRDLLSQYTDQDVNVFIPPHNQLSEGAEEALKKTDFNLVSSEGNNYLDYHAATYYFPTKQFIPAKQVIEDCETRFKNGYEVCVIMLHPQDFALSDQSLDTNLYQEYIKILDWIEQRRYQAVTMNAVHDAGFHAHTPNLATSFAGRKVN